VVGYPQPLTDGQPEPSMVDHPQLLILVTITTNGWSPAPTITDGHPQQHIVGCPVAQQASDPSPQIVFYIHNHQWLAINNQVIVSYPQKLMVAPPRVPVVGSNNRRWLIIENQLKVGYSQTPTTTTNCWLPAPFQRFVIHNNYGLVIHNHLLLFMYNRKILIHKKNVIKHNYLTFKHIKSKV
jgi:hypothetical protein